MNKHIWNELDNAASANLRPSDLNEFHRYKQQLFDEGHEWAGDAGAILAGFIWDTIECYGDDE